ncbi:MAG: hypothetical protein C0424_10110 [Sphingobacteriaceae bacterium]|nr:hypothetical protein [Sphingobacteriaceae bacterium]
MNQFHIQGQLVELGTNTPLRHAGVKFIVFKSHKSSPLVSAVHIPVDSFETDANGRYDHVFKTPELLENFRVKIVGTIPGYFGNRYTYNFTSSADALKRVHLVRIVRFTFKVDNRNGSPNDMFSYIMPGMVGFNGFAGNELHSFESQQGAFSPFTINFGDWQTDSTYLIPIFIDSLESYTYTHVIGN